MAPKSIHGNPFGAENGAARADTTDYILIQTKHPVAADEQATLQEFGAFYQRALGDRTYLFRYDPSDLSVIRGLPFVEFVDIYHQHLKFSSSFAQAGIHRSALLSGEQASSISESSHAALTANDAPETPIREDPLHVGITLHDDAKETAIDIVGQLVQAGVISNETTSVLSTKRIDTEISPVNLTKISSIDSVAKIDPYLPKVDDIDIARTLMTDCAYSITSNAEYTGAGQVIAVGDTGFDKGDMNDIHPAFQAGTILSMTTPFTGSGEPVSDTKGHGTHVCGCIAASTTSNSMAGGRRIRGTAPGAKLMMIRNQNSAGILWPRSIVPDYIQVPYLSVHQARLFNESWGTPWNHNDLPYNSEAGDIDNFVIEQPEAFVCISAGNTGRIGSVKQIGAERAAKNITVVGSCDCTRPMVDPGIYTPTKPTDNDHYVVSDFSSKGPTVEGRFKPDVVAPGNVILSSLSRLPTDRRVIEKCGISADSNLWFDQGTSFPTPLTTGVAAVIRQALIDRPRDAVPPPTPTPAAALVKALLINGAVPLDPATVVPNNLSGFGRVNLSGSLAHLEIPTPPALPRGGFVPGTITLTSTVTAVQITVPELQKVELTGDTTPYRLRVTLVWMDVSGAQTENILHLTVMKAGEPLTATCGNRAPGAVDAASPDLVNTVQRVDWVDIPTGVYNAEVTCTKTKTLTDVIFYVAWYLF